VAGRVQRFEDLLAWQKARELHKQLMVVMKQERFARAWPIRDQIERASSSIMANIAEGFERTGSSEFHHKLSIAKGECGEIRSHIYAAYDSGYLLAPEFDQLLSLSNEVGSLVGRLRASVDRSR
jgi:four helix bundle protein